MLLNQPRFYASKRRPTDAAVTLLGAGAEAAAALALASGADAGALAKLPCSAHATLVPRVSFVHETRLGQLAWQMHTPC